jgi:predicted nucleic acid-binding protein
MTALIDSNVVLDVFLDNVGLATGSKAVIDLAEEKRFIGYISASAVTDIFYISQKKLGKKGAKEALKKLLCVVKPATVTDGHIFQALDLDWDDFEDSVQFTVGESLSADYIVTRNTRDFSPSYIPAVTPEQFMHIIIDDDVVDIEQ